VVCGFNYRFGAGGQGTPANLQEFFDAPGFSGVTVWPEMTVDGLTVSSTHIRQALIAGDMDVVTSLLGRPYHLESRVVYGKRLGNTLGFPTANQFFPAERLIPAHGVYATLAHTRQGVFPAVSNVGVRPTVEGDVRHRINCETYLIGFDGDLYGQTVRVEFLSHLRGEERFDSLEALRAAISADADTAYQIVGNMC
jgi:riboflavin kinase/FMN adenylyltransferase